MTTQLSKRYKTNDKRIVCDINDINNINNINNTNKIEKISYISSINEEKINNLNKNKTNIQNNSPLNSNNQWQDINELINNNTFFGNETGSIPLGLFKSGNETFEFIQNECKILVVGAGGLGCEILKDLALSGFKYIDIIDMDTIDLSNLNRQFLFREKDIGKSKAFVAAESINHRIHGVHITPYHSLIQDKSIEFYQKYNIIISGLDNIEARRWLNSVILSLVEKNELNDTINVSTIIPFIDGGSEGLCGQARVIIPTITSCFECTLDMFPPQKSFPMCTIAETPRQPSHCIAYALMILWPKYYPNTKLDTDSIEHLQWIYEKSIERANQYGITGVTYMYTIGVVKNIIPAVSFTNAIISGICVNEVFKIMSYSSQTMNNFMMHMGKDGIYSYTFISEKNPTCLVCSNSQKKISISNKITLQEFINKLKDKEFRLKNPSITSNNKTIFMQAPPALYEATKKNLNITMDHLINNNEIITITDPSFIRDLALSLHVSFI